MSIEEIVPVLFVCRAPDAYVCLKCPRVAECGQGDWLVKTVRHGEQATNLACAFTETNGSLTGTCRGAEQDGPGTSITGHVRGEHVEWQFEIALAPNERKHAARFVGTVNRSGNAMDGSLAIADERGTFTATRRR